MAERKSLAEGSGFESIGRKSGGSQGGKSNSDTMKLFLAIGLLVVAAVVLGWYYDIIPGFGGKKALPPPPNLTPQQQEQAKEIQKKDELRKDVQKGSS
jgi:hypothetical protein